MPENTVMQTSQPEWSALATLLAAIQRPGDYFTSGRIETPMPSLQVDGVGRISFPVPTIQARALIEHAAERAPYGRGTATVRDDSVRRVWQVLPTQVQLAGKAWEASLARIVSQVAEGLGCQGIAVRAELYKLLIYETGDFFVAHRDSEKCAGMFATLVVALPSEHSGGTLSIRHAGREAQVDLANSETDELRFAAFYADCEHEVQALRSGYRLCLIYNLVQAPQQRQPVLQAPDRRAQVHTCAGLLNAWAQRTDGPPKLVYPLEHHYTEAGLCFAALKNGDAAKADVLRDAAAQAACALHLGMIHIEESGSAEYSGRGWRGRHWQADDQDFEIGEVFDHHRYLGPWRDRDDQPVEFGRIALEDDELLPADALADEEPDDVHFSEATGNEGASFERTWLRAALVLWPHARFDEVCLAAGTEAALARLHILLGGADRSTHPHPHDVAAAIRLIGAIAERWRPDAPAEGIHLTQLLGHAQATADATVIEHLFSGLLLARYDGLQNAAIHACAQHLDQTRRLPLLSALFEHHAAARPAACLTLWLLLARADAADPALIDALAASLVAHLAECAPDRRLPHYHFEMHTNEDGPVGDIDDDDIDDDIINLVAPASYREQPPAPTMSADLVAEFVIALGQCGLAAHQAQAVAAMTANARVFAAESILLPALERIAGNTPTAAASAVLWRHCGGHYLARSETAPQPPLDWARAADLAGHCADCQELQDFARNSQAPSHRFRLREDRRQHLETQIRSHQLDIATRTERQGSPHTLICTKTRASYERAARQYQEDRTDMARLLALTERIDVPDANVCERLRTALAAQSTQVK